MSNTATLEMEEIKQLFARTYGVWPLEVTAITGAGSNRLYYRLKHPDGTSVIGVKGTSREENHALADQIRRSSVSIPSNIAEGYGRTSPKEYARFLSMARGSSYELETQIILCVDLGYIREADTVKAIELCKEVARILTRILQSLGNKQEIKAR